MLDLVCLCHSSLKMTTLARAAHMALEDVALAPYCPLHGDRKCAEATGHAGACDFAPRCDLICGRLDA